jgi:nitrogen fixation protein FixH
MSIAEPRPFSGRKFLAVLLGAFAVVAAANGLLIWYALSTWSGLVSDSAYQEGLGFDRVLAESRAEAALGWQATIEYDPHGRISVVLVDAKAQPLAGMQLSMLLLRPTREGFDRAFPLSETSPGRYEAAVRPPLPGQWDARVTVKSAGAIRFHAERRIIVPQ